MSHIPHNRVKSNGKVDLWDCGPQAAPKPPAAPVEPDKSKLKGADLALAEIEYEDGIARYKDDLRKWKADREEHRHFMEEKGPVKIELWGADARHALEREPDRYFIDLPKGLKPGKAQAEADKMAAIEAEEIRQARSRDPMHSGAPA